MQTEQSVFAHESFVQPLPWYTFMQEEFIKTKVLSQADSYFATAFSAKKLITVHDITITPTDAEQLLKLFNVNNRKQSKANTANLLDMMLDDVWYADAGVVHVNIGLGTFFFGGKSYINGSMQGGQHVMESCVAFGKPIKASFSLNANANHRMAVDGVMPRTPKTHMVADANGDEAKAKRIAAASEIITSLVRDIFLSRSKPAKNRIEDIYAVLHDDVDWVYDLTKDSKVCGCSTMRNAPFRTAATAILLMNRHTGRDFISKVVNGPVVWQQIHGSMSVDCPAFKLWEDLVGNKFKRHGGGYTVIGDVFRHVFNAWEKTHAGIATKKFKGKKVQFDNIVDDICATYPILVKYKRVP